MAEYLIIQLARLGDLVQSKRLVLSLAREGKVHIALEQSLLPLAQLLYPFAELHPVRAHAGGLSPDTVLSENAVAFSVLRSLDFTRIYNLNRSRMALAISGLFDPDSVCGYRLADGQELHSVWSRMALRWSRERIISPINLADFWAFFHPDPIAPESVNPVAQARNLPGVAGGQKIGVVLSGREARRSLPPEYLARCLEALFAARKGPELILLGNATEQEVARKLCKNLNHSTLQRVQDLSGKTSITDLYEVLQGLDLLFTPDTGSMHLAAHLGVPVMAVFFSSAWAYETGPYGLGHTVWQSFRSCSPCLETAPCPFKVACLAPFKAEDWLAHLAGRNSQGWPAGLMGLVTTLDSLGSTCLCVDGEEESLRSSERLSRRACLLEYLGQVDGASPVDITALSIDELLRESDWMLPDYAGSKLRWE